MFSIRGKKVVRLRHRLSRSKIFKQAPDSVLSRSRNLADSPKDFSRRILKLDGNGQGHLPQLQWKSLGTLGPNHPMLERLLL